MGRIIDGKILRHFRVHFQQLQGMPAMVVNIRISFVQHAPHRVDFILQGVAVHHGKFVVMVVAVLRLIGMVVDQPVRPHVAAMVDRCVQQHAQAPPLQSRHGDDRHAQHFRQAVQVDFHSPLFYDIHHVQGDDDGLA